MKLLFAAIMLFVNQLYAAERAPHLYVVAKSGAVFHVLDQKQVGYIKPNDKPAASIMNVSFDPVANNLYVVDAPYLERGGMFVIDAKSFRQKKFLPRVQHVITSAADSARQLEVQYIDNANPNNPSVIDRTSLKLGKTWIEYPWVYCLDVSKQPERKQELLAEAKKLSRKLYSQGCYSRNGKSASQQFIQQSSSLYTFRQIGASKFNAPFAVATISVQGGECAMNAVKAICWPWQLSKKFRAELIDLASGEIRKVPQNDEDAPNGPANIFSVGTDFLVLQVGNNSKDFTYYIASESTNWDLKAYDALNKIKGEWLVGMYEIEE
jgi:hypothetical protein